MVEKASAQCPGDTLMQDVYAREGVGSKLLAPFKFLARHKGSIGKAMAIIVFLALCWLPAVVINNVMGYAPGIFATFAIVFSGVYLLLLRNGLDWAEATRVSECIRGEQVDFVVRLVNKSILLYPRIQVVFYQSDLFENDGRVTSSDIILTPRAKRDFTFQMCFDHIGTYSAGLKRVVIHDLLGLFHITYENPTTQEIEVLPRTHEMGDVVFDSEAPTQSTKAIRTVLNEGMDYAFVRDYVWGDPIKSIHWKLSARSENYLTRIYESNANPGLTTVIDIHAPKANAATLMQLYDGVVESALSLNEYARHSGLESTMVYMDDCGSAKRYEGRVEHDGLRQLMGLLKEDSSCYEGNAASLLRDELNSPYAQSNIALCTSALDESLVETLLAIKARRKNPLLFYAIPQGLEPGEHRALLAPLRRLDEAHISFCVFSDVQELTAEGGAA